ncbi:MAG: MerR family transcriptional regulator [Lachnospiraceae bacterium]
MGLKISDVAKEFEITTHTIRYYDKLGLLTQIQRGEGGVRCFTQEDIDRLGVIKCLKNTGMTMQDIKEFMDIYSEEQSGIDLKRKRIEKQKEILEAKVQELEEHIDQSNFKLWFFDHMVVDGIEPPYSEESYRQWQEAYHTWKKEQKNNL